MASTFKLVLFALGLTTTAALAQNAGERPAPARAHVPLQKTIGQARSTVVPSLIVMNARGAGLAGGKLTLTGLSPNAIVFADRPVRAAGHDLASRLIELWNPASDDPRGFAKSPPNATVSVFGRDGANIRDMVVVLKSPKLDGDRLTFDVDVLEGDIAGSDGAAAVFIDLVALQMPREPEAGAGLRQAARGAAWYAGAPVYGGLAGAIAASPTWPYQPPGCGGYGQPACY